jgi:hypothetical protein
MNGKTKILVVFPLVFIIVLTMAGRLINIEKYILEYKKNNTSKIWSAIRSAPPEISVRQRGGITITERTNSPIKFPSESKAEAFPPLPLDELVSQIDYNDTDTLSLIVVTDGSRMAIIRGIVVKEGDLIGKMKVARIEHNRVLLKNGKDIWLKLKQNRY